MFLDILYRNGSSAGGVGAHVTAAAYYHQHSLSAAVVSASGLYSVLRECGRLWCFVGCKFNILPGPLAISLTSSGCSLQ
jgi:hypothetical protein